jgi:hypothetical protein
MLIDLIDKLLDRGIQLLMHRGRLRKDLLDNYVGPVFCEFEQVHTAYLESFSRYRDMIQGAQEPSWIGKLQATIEKDNLFSASSRSKVVRLAKGKADDKLESFINGICEYIMGARLVVPLGKDVDPVSIQRWRQGFVLTLSAIEEERWQLVIDPDGAMAPLSPEEIEHHLKERHDRYPADTAADTMQDSLKKSCALSALDTIVREMQYQYDHVCQAYTELKELLLR